MFTHIYYFQGSLFLLFKCIFPHSIIFFCPKDFLWHFLPRGSSGMNSFSFSTSAFVDWKISAGYRILNYFFPLPLTILKVHLHRLLTYIISGEKSTVILSFAPRCVMCIFLWLILRFSLHQLVLNNSVFVCLGVIFFSFLGIDRTS